MLAGVSARLYDVYRSKDSVLAAIYEPKQSRGRSGRAGLPGYAAAQRALVDLASRPSQSIDARRVAMKAFRRNTDKFGVLLNRTEIRRQYDRYNQSGGQNLAAQQVLGSILNCIEAHTHTAAAAPAAKPAPVAKTPKKD